jgi:hypothetical protein
VFSWLVLLECDVKAWSWTWWISDTPNFIDTEVTGMEGSLQEISRKRQSQFEELQGWTTNNVDPVGIDVLKPCVTMAPGPICLSVKVDPYHTYQPSEPSSAERQNSIRGWDEDGVYSMAL